MCVFSIPINGGAGIVALHSPRLVVVALARFRNHEKGTQIDRSLSQAERKRRDQIDDGLNLKTCSLIR